MTVIRLKDLPTGTALAKTVGVTSADVAAGRANADLVTDLLGTAGVPEAIGTGAKVVQAGTGAQARTLQNIFRDKISVTDFDTVANAVTAAGGTKQLFFPSGVYSSAAAITVPNGAYWEFSPGAYINFTNDTDGLIIGDGTVDWKGWLINVDIEHASAGSTKAAFKLNRAKLSIFSRIVGYNFRHGIHFADSASNGSYYNVFNSAIMSTNGSGGAPLYMNPEGYANANQFNACRFSPQTGDLAAIYLTHSGAGYCDGNEFSGGSAEGTGPYSIYCNESGNLFDHVRSEGTWSTAAIRFDTGSVDNIVFLPYGGQNLSDVGTNNNIIAKSGIHFVNVIADPGDVAVKLGRANAGTSGVFAAQIVDKYSSSGASFVTQLRAGRASLSTGSFLQCVDDGSNAVWFDLKTDGGVVFYPPASVTPPSNGTLMIEATNNTTLTFKFKGTDGTVRSGTLALS